jgi:hypothetical protein
MRTLLAVTLASLPSCNPDTPGIQPDALELRLPPVATQPPVPTDGDVEPQDLEPTDSCRHAWPPEFARLVEGTDSVLSMVCAPSFTRSYAVALVTEGDEQAADRDHPRCFVHYIAAAPAGTQRPARPTDPPASAISEIDASSAASIRDAWELVVRRTRYPRPHYETIEIEGRVERVEWLRMGCDGTTYRFESGKYCGTTWSPKAELTWGIVELGDALRDYALADEAHRPQQLARCLDLARKLQAAAERRPW